MAHINRILSTSAAKCLLVLAPLAYLAWYATDHLWIDSALLMTRVIFVFVVLSLLPKIKPWLLLPLAVLSAPAFDRLLELSESQLLDVVRVFVPQAVNPQFALIMVVAVLLVVVIAKLLLTRRLRYLFLSVFLVANIAASSLFHYTQVDRFIALESERLDKQSNLLIANLHKSGFEKIDSICGLHGLYCVHGTNEVPTPGIDEDFHGMFLQAVQEHPASYRRMRKFAESNDDPTKADMFQIFIYHWDGKWIYIEDQDIIAPYYFNARRNFSILYSAFSTVWLIILAYVLYRHERFLDRPVRLSSK